jgi:molybdopterin-guanine dinucleotide biosynthesis protein MobB
MKGRKILGIVGWKNSGKTTLVEALVRELTARGLRVSTLKHAHHAFDIDVPGKDSYRHREAGAHEVIVASGQRWALMHELGSAPEPRLDELLIKLAPCDLVLVEGFKCGRHPKIEVARFIRDEGLIADQDDTVLAVATDNAIFAGRHLALPLNDAIKIAEFICRRLGFLSNCPAPLVT